MNSKRLKSHVVILSRHGQTAPWLGNEGVTYAVLRDHLRSKVASGHESECWPFSGARSRIGYGRLSQRIGPREEGRRRWMLAHRVAFEIANGPIEAGLMVLHRCDNPPCCNPSHLYAADHKQNMEDIVARRRLRHGESNHSAVLTEAQVMQIRAERDASPPVKLRVLSGRYGVSINAISAAAMGKTWSRAGTDEPTSAGPPLMSIKCPVCSAAVGASCVAVQRYAPGKPIGTALSRPHMARRVPQGTRRET